jgi:hypothetical protein
MSLADNGLATIVLHPDPESTLPPPRTPPGPQALQTLPPVCIYIDTRLSNVNVFVVPRHLGVPRTTLPGATLLAAAGASLAGVAAADGAASGGGVGTAAGDRHPRLEARAPSIPPPPPSPPSARRPNVALFDAFHTHGGAVPSLCVAIVFQQDRFSFQLWLI